MVDDNEYPPHLPLVPAMIKHPLNNNEYPDLFDLIRHRPPPPIPAAPVRCPPSSPASFRHTPPRRPAPTPIRSPPSSPASFRHPPPPIPAAPVRCPPSSPASFRHPPPPIPAAPVRCPPSSPASFRHPPPRRPTPTPIRCPPSSPASFRHPPPRRPTPTPTPIRCPPSSPASFRHPPPRRPAPTPIRCPPSSPASFRHPPPRHPRESLASVLPCHPPDVVLCSYVPDLQHKHDGHYSDCQKLYFKHYYTFDDYLLTNTYIRIKDYIPFTIDCDTYRPVRISLRPLKKSLLGQQLLRRHSFPTFPSDEWQGFWPL